MPPWGRDLEAEHPVEAKMAHAEEHHGERLRVFGPGRSISCGGSATPRRRRCSRRARPAPTGPAQFGQTGTKVLFGNEIDYTDRHGARFTIGYAFALEQGWAAEATCFFLDGRDVGLHRSSPGNPVLARPFFDVINEREDSSLISFPGLLQGGIEIHNSSRLHGAELNGLKRLSWGEQLQGRADRGRSLAAAR